MNLHQTVCSIPVNVLPRFGHPGDAALFVGQDLYHDYFFFPLSRVAVVRSHDREQLLTAHEETAFDAARYDFAVELFELTASGEVCA